VCRIALPVASTPRLVDTAADGTLFISDVDKLAPTVQEQLLALLEELDVVTRSLGLEISA
jgi:transcriptional regulator with AAA-type ATPase domain